MVFGWPPGIATFLQLQLTNQLTRDSPIPEVCQSWDCCYASLRPPDTCPALPQIYVLPHYCFRSLLHLLCQMDGGPELTRNYKDSLLLDQIWSLDGLEGPVIGYNIQGLIWHPQIHHVLPPLSLCAKHLYCLGKFCFLFLAVGALVSVMYA